MVEENHTVTFEVARWDLEVVCHELSASAQCFPLAWSALRAARTQARSLRGQPARITLTQDSATRLVDWIDDHASPLTAQRFAKEAFSRFLTAIMTAERTTTARRRPGKVISVPITELPAEMRLGLGDIDAIGRLLTVAERRQVRRVLEHYTPCADGPVWVTFPTDVQRCFRFTERPDLAIE